MIGEFEDIIIEITLNETQKKINKQSIRGLWDEFTRPNIMCVIGIPKGRGWGRRF